MMEDDDGRINRRSVHIGHQLPLDLTLSGFISGGILNSRTM